MAKIRQQMVSWLSRAFNTNSNDSVLSVLTVPPELLIPYNASWNIYIPSGFRNKIQSSSSSNDYSDHRKMPSTAATYNEEDSDNKGGEGIYNALLEAKK